MRTGEEMILEKECYSQRVEIYARVKAWAREGKYVGEGTDWMEYCNCHLERIFGGHSWRWDKNLHAALLGPHGYTVLRMHLMKRRNEQKSNTGRAPETQSG